ncbi:MAG: hypothetical protein LBG16_02165 [Elusimicrobiota bacterium]|jgi:hypothetical protein|nr:hypothetical protein [Elusimicrobiota bacterium]
MKKFFLPFTLVCAAALLAGCFNKKTETLEDEVPYRRSAQKSYENKMTYAVFLPFLYEDGFYSYYALGKKVSGPDDKGYYTARFTNGPKTGEEIKTKNILLKVRPASAGDLKKGMVVLVNHWDPRSRDDNTPVDLWRKGIVYNLEKLSDGLVMVEFPNDRNDFMATKETYGLGNIWLILEPVQKDPRIFL